MRYWLIILKSNDGMHRARVIAGPDSPPIFTTRSARDAGMVKREVERLLGTVHWRGWEEVQARGFHDPSMKWIAPIEISSVCCCGICLGIQETLAKSGGL